MPLGLYLLRTIQQKHMADQKYCPNFSMYIYQVNEAQNRIDIARARCKSWKCDYCAPINKNIWIARMLYATNTIGGDWSFVTLTAHRRTRTTYTSHKNLAVGWNRLNLRAKRAFPAFSYVRVWELHQDGAFHAHFLWYGRPTERWLKDNSAECGMGYMADESALEADSAQAVFYCAKYMTKDDGTFPKGTRRIVASRNFPDRVDDDERCEWKVIGDTLEEYDAWTLAWNRNYDMYDLQEKKKLTLDDFNT